MAKAIVDPNELRRFAKELDRFKNDLRHQSGVFHGRLAALGETWKDQEERKFAEEFEVTMKALAKFVSAADRHVPFLLRKAERIEEYLQQR